MGRNDGVTYHGSNGVLAEVFHEGQYILECLLAIV